MSVIKIHLLEEVTAELCSTIGRHNIFSLYPSFTFSDLRTGPPPHVSTPVMLSQMSQCPTSEGESGIRCPSC